MRGITMGILKCAHLFSDNMVLQRNKNITVWGIANDGTNVNVEIDGRCASGVANHHKWSVTLPPMKAGGPYTLKVSNESGDCLVYQNIMIGEVWLAGGQSNMELELRNSLHGKEMIKNMKDNNVRFFYVKKSAYIDEYFYQEEADNSWMEAGDEQAGIWSAVGFYFAKKLSEVIGVTVGVIGCNWGGTSASNWISKEMLESDVDTQIYLRDYEKAVEGKTFLQHLKEKEEYKKWHEDWQPRMDAFYASNPDATWEEAQESVGISKWPGPLGPTHEYRPYGLYETMLKRVIPYTLAGFIYYQGESDDHHPEIYDKLLRNLITQWRNDWEDNRLPFICVQLPMHMNKGAEDTKNWCLIREAQMKVHETIANTGIAVAIDLGEFNNIHPIDKKPVGERLALQALHHVYDVVSDQEAYGPMYDSFLYDKDKIILSFRYAEDGFMLKDGKTNGFEIAGTDQIYYKAEASIRGSQIVVSGIEVKEPKYVRYLWTNYSEVYIFGKNGLPLAPFRSHLA